MLSRKMIAATALVLVAFGCRDEPIAPEPELQPSVNQSDMMNPYPYEIRCPDTSIWIDETIQCGAWFASPIGWIEIGTSGWSSSNTSVATATLGGYVTGVSEGSAVITAYSIFDNAYWTDTITVAVEPFPPLNAWIVGPDAVHPFSAQCSWFAQTQWGIGSKSYQWYKDGIPVGTNSTYHLDGPIMGDFLLEVEVEDSVGDDDYDSIQVDSNLAAGYCGS